MKNPLTKSTQLRKITEIKYSRRAPKGSGYCEDIRVYIAEVSEWKIFGFTYWKSRTPLWDVGAGDWIASATLGS